MVAAFGVLIAAQVLSVVWVVGLLNAVWGPDIPDFADLPLWALPVLNLGLWVGYLLGPVWYRRAVGWTLWDRRELGMTGQQAGLAVAVGVGLQLVVLPALYFLLGLFIDADPGASARELVDRVDGPLDVAWLVLSVLVVAPLVEEWFFRGLLLPAMAHKMGLAGAAVGSSVVFALVHQIPVVMPGLFVVALVLALLVQRTGRLGPAIVAHLAFNAVTVVQLLVFPPT
jgi:membrane protease YdiL (CAAX protease family)